MKNAVEFGKVYGGTYLTEDERSEIDRLVSNICNNHKNDSWWEIANSIMMWVQARLSRELSYAEYAEYYESEQEKE